MNTADMKPSGACRALVRQFEGCRLQAYLDSVGIPTIGVGHTRGVKMGDHCTVQQADLWLSQDLEDAAAAVASLVKVPLTQGQFDALVSLTYNCGAKAIGKSTLIKLINQGSMEAAAYEFPKWCKAGGKVLAGLLNRRKAEMELFKRK
jgi:lysozyme